MEQDRIKERLLKMYRLATDGVDGEKETAQKILEAASKCDECGKEHAKLAEWLQELQGYKDETPITNEFLEIVGLKREKITAPYHKGKISIQKMCGCIGDWTWECVYFKGKSWTSDLVDTVFIKTIGELRMFLTLCGLGDLAKQSKS